MPILGTKKFWRPADGQSANQSQNQILKNAGYINLQLRTVNYMSVGNFWQNTFGGRDNIALATTLKYQTGVDSIEATSVQDVREVKVNKNYNLGLQRNIAVKIPANADAISMDVKITAVKNDALQAKFDMLNKPEYQSALQLAPAVVGQVITITSLVKKLFTDSDPHAELEASYAGIISAQQEANPVANGKLTQGLLIMISTNEGDSFSNTDESKFEMRGDSLYYDDNEVENTYLVFSISFEKVKGDDEKSNWFKKYNNALGNLDKIQLTFDKDEISKILKDSQTLWIEGNALLDDDPSYLNAERINIKSAAIKAINDKYKTLNPPVAEAKALSVSEMLKGVTGFNSFTNIRHALPNTGSVLNKYLSPDPAKSIFSDSLAGLAGHEDKIAEALDHDTAEYFDELQKNNIVFKLGR